MKALLWAIAFLGAIVIYHPPVAYAEEARAASDVAAISENIDSSTLLFYNAETGDVVRILDDGGLLDVDPSQVKIKSLRSEALASEDSESLVRRYYHHHHYYHHRYYRRYYYGYNPLGAFGLFMGGLFYHTVAPCGLAYYNPWYCWY